MRAKLSRTAGPRLVLAVSLGLSACATEGPTSPSDPPSRPAPVPGPTAAPPPPPPAATSAPLRITVDGNTCRTQVSSADISVDGSFVGTAPPGGFVSRTVSIGGHSVTARAREGVTWSHNVTVGAAGLNFSLLCSAEAPFSPQFLRDWGTANTRASSGGAPVLQICVRDHECEDGDVARVLINGAAVLQRELFNAPYCANFRFNPGQNTISLYAVNGTGYKGACDHANVNTGEISVSNLQANGAVISTVRQVWRVRAAAGTESRIVVNLVR